MYVYLALGKGRRLWDAFALLDFRIDRRVIEEEGEERPTEGNMKKRKRRWT